MKSDPKADPIDLKVDFASHGNNNKDKKSPFLPSSDSQTQKKDDKISSLNSFLKTQTGLFKSTTGQSKRLQKSTILKKTGQQTQIDDISEQATIKSTQNSQSIKNQGLSLSSSNQPQPATDPASIFPNLNSSLSTLGHPIFKKEELKTAQISLDQQKTVKPKAQQKKGSFIFSDFKAIGTSFKQSSINQANKTNQAIQKKQAQQKAQANIKSQKIQMQHTSLTEAEFQRNTSKKIEQSFSKCANFQQSTQNKLQPKSKVQARVEPKIKHKIQAARVINPAQNDSDKALGEEVKQDIRRGQGLPQKQDINRYLANEKNDKKNQIISLLKNNKNPMMLKNPNLKYDYECKQRIKDLKQINAGKIQQIQLILKQNKTLDEQYKYQSQIAQIEASLQPKIITLPDIKPSITPQQFQSMFNNVLPPSLYTQLQASVQKLRQINKNIDPVNDQLRKELKQKQIFFQNEKLRLQNLDKEFININVLEDQSELQSYIKAQQAERKRLQAKYDLLKKQVKGLKPNRISLSPQISRDSLIL